MIIGTPTLVMGAILLDKRKARINGKIVRITLTSEEEKVATVIAASSITLPLCTTVRVKGKIVRHDGSSLTGLCEVLLEGEWVNGFSTPNALLVTQTKGKGKMLTEYVDIPVTNTLNQKRVISRGRVLGKVEDATCISAVVIPNGEQIQGSVTEEARTKSSAEVTLSTPTAAATEKEMMRDIEELCDHPENMEGYTSQLDSVRSLYLDMGILHGKELVSTHDRPENMAGCAMTVLS